MGDRVAISLKNVSKCFKCYDHPIDRLKEILLPGKNRGKEFWALHDINLEINRGETLGIVGRNGSGKSTLLQIIVGTLTPTFGEVNVKGRISALLELGSGFNPEFTGRQNVFFNGKILGLSKAEIEAKFDEIAAFADIGDFIEQPVKTYSSGMFVRLAFAVAINIEPEILVVDEALSVGDGVFVHRCMAKIKDFQDNGGTILFVSHDIGSVTRLCSRCIWINQGQLVENGHPIEVSQSYQAWMYKEINQRIETELKIEDRKEENPNELVIKEDLIQVNNKQENFTDDIYASTNPFTKNPYRSFSGIKRFGTGRSEIIEFTVTDIAGKETHFVLPDDLLIIDIKLISHDRVRDPIVGISIYDRLRSTLTAWNTSQYKHKLPQFSPGNVISVKFTVKWPHIKDDNYSLEPAVADGSQENHEMLDWIQNPITLQSGVTDLTLGLMRFPHIEIDHNITQVEDNYVCSSANIN
jgi:lipopolysaccharide transport system ATP-binding protein